MQPRRARCCMPSGASGRVYGRTCRRPWRTGCGRAHAAPRHEPPRRVEPLAWSSAIIEPTVASAASAADTRHCARSRRFAFRVVHEEGGDERVRVASRYICVTATSSASSGTSPVAVHVSYSDDHASARCRWRSAASPRIGDGGGGGGGDGGGGGGGVGQVHGDAGGGRAAAAAAAAPLATAETPARRRRRARGRAQPGGAGDGDGEQGWYERVRLRRSSAWRASWRRRSSAEAGPQRRTAGCRAALGDTLAAPRVA